MKTLTSNFFNLVHNHNQNQRPLCQNELKSSSSPRSLLWLRCLPKVILCQIRQSVPRVSPVGLDALANVTRAKLFGYVLLVVGVVTIFAHQFFFDEKARDYSWIYLNWYYYFFTNRLFIVLILWSMSLVILVPAKSSLVPISAVVFQSAGWIGLIHNSFFVETNDQFLEWPHVSVWIIGAAFSLGFTLTVKYQTYWWNHKVRGNHARFVGVAEMRGLSPEEKERLSRLLAEEYRGINNLI